MHGTPRSRLEWLFFVTDEMTRAAHIRMIVPDRPGIGLSEFQPERKVIDWPDDGRQFADHLGLNRFAVLGFSGGCPYALMCAERITSVGIVSGIGPHNVPGLTDGMNPNPLRVLRMSVERPAAFRLICAMLGLLARVSPRLFVAQASSAFSPVDQQVLQQNRYRDGFVAMFREALRQGTKGLKQDVALMVSPWDFQPRDVRVPVVMWQGGLDTDATPAMAHYLTEQIPHARLTFFEEEGHMSLFAKHVQDVLSAVVAAA